MATATAAETGKIQPRLKQRYRSEITKAQREEIDQMERIAERLP